MSSEGSITEPATPTSPRPSTNSAKSLPAPTSPPVLQHANTFPSSSSSTDSSLERNIPSILRASSSLTLNSSRSASSSGVTFAPLPNLEPRRRNSNVQLGVAARSRMLRSRRMVLTVEPPDDDSVDRRPQLVITPSLWTQPLPPQLGYRDPGLAEDAVEDAFIALGKFVKGAGKSLWKKVAHNQREKGKKTTVASDSPHALEKDKHPSRLDAEEENVTVRVLVKKPVNLLQHTEHDDHDKDDSDQAEDSNNGKGKGAQIIDGTRESVESEQGGVWEEEVSEETKKRLVASAVANGASTTKDKAEATKVQGTVISVRTATVEAGLSKSRGPRMSTVIAT